MKKSLLVLIFLFLTLVTNLQAQDFIFGPQNSKIKGSIKYTVIGNYVASFDSFSGKLEYDPAKKMIKSVYLKIDASTIKSSTPVLDKIVKSPKILDIKKFPYIIFQSSEVVRSEDQFKVKGVLEMHGVKKEVLFNFDSDDLIIQKDRSTISAWGKWVIARKDFGVIWNKVLDQGGVLVGNYLIVNWEVNAVNP